MFVPKLPPSDPDAMRIYRQIADLTQDQCTELVRLGDGRRWSEYESGARKPSKQVVMLFTLLTDQHPELRLVKRRKPLKG